MKRSTLLTVFFTLILLLLFTGTVSAGTVTVAAEAKLAGLGELLPPTEVTLLDRETAAGTLVRALNAAGYAVYYGGTPESGFYLAYLGDGDGPAAFSGYTGSLPDKPRALPKDASFAPEVAAYLTAHADYFDPDDYRVNFPGKLGEFVFTDGAGWMYQYNGAFPNVALSDFSLSDGDTLILRFTLLTGRDLKGEVPFAVPSPVIPAPERTTAPPEPLPTQATGRTEPTAPTEQSTQPMPTDAPATVPATEPTTLPATEPAVRATEAGTTLSSSAPVTVPATAPTTLPPPESVPGPAPTEATPETTSPAKALPFDELGDALTVVLTLVILAVLIACVGCGFYKKRKRKGEFQ